jgi:cyclophilin family peptidyl-prolyl cis-trans isomerase
MTEPSSTTAPSTWTHVTFETNIGTFVIELYHQHTPRTCYNIAALAHAGYYNHTIFHRVVRDFMIQGGDPTGTGRGGESIYGGGKFEDEMTRNLKHTGAGVVSMANSGPHTNGSQFFVTLRPTPWLDGKHTIFGRIYRGMGVIQRMGMVATDADDRPTHPITIYQARAHCGAPPVVVAEEESTGATYTAMTLTAS